MSQDKDKTLFFRRFSKIFEGVAQRTLEFRRKFTDKTFWKMEDRYRLFLRREIYFSTQGKEINLIRRVRYPFVSATRSSPSIYIWCFACTYYSISRFLQTVKTYFARKKKKKYEILIYELFTILKLWTNYLWFSLVKISLKVSFEQNEISYPPMQYLFRMKFSFLSSICLRSLKRRSRTFRGKCLYHLRAAWRQRGNDV